MVEDGIGQSIFVGSGACFSNDRIYRYSLWRRWDNGPTLNFICLNPSTADETRNDPTVTRLERRARTGEALRGLLQNKVITGTEETKDRIIKATAHTVVALADACLDEMQWGSRKSDG